MNAGPLVQKIFQAPSKTPGTFWIQGLGWDLFWIFPGIWLFPLILFLDDLDPIYAVGVFLFWIGHRVVHFTSAGFPLLSVHCSMISGKGSSSSPWPFCC